MKKKFWIVLIINLYFDVLIAFESFFLKKQVEWGPYKPDYIYAWSQEHINPLIFGFCYSSLKVKSQNMKDFLIESISKKKDSVKTLRNNPDLLINNLDNLRFYSKNKNLISKYVINDGLNFHEKFINDEELGISFNFKGIKKTDGFAIFLNIDGNSKLKDYYSMFFYVYSPNNNINSTFIDKKLDIIINNLLRFKLVTAECRNNILGFFTYSTKIESKFNNRIDDILLDILDNKPLLPEDEMTNDSNLLFLQAILPINQKCQMQILQGTMDTKFQEPHYFMEDFKKNTEFYNKSIITKFFFQDLNPNHKILANNFNELFSEFMGSLAHFSGKIPTTFTLNDGPLFKTKNSYSILSYEPYSLFSHGFGLFLTCKYNLVLCTSLLKNLLDQINFAGWLPIHLNFPEFSAFSKEKETLTTPPTFLMAIEFLIKTISLYPKSIHPELLNFLYNFIKFEVYPKVQLVFKYYLYSFRRLPGKYESIKTPYFHWNEGRIGDYPRIFQNDNTAEHLDLLIWISDAALVLVQMSVQLGLYADKEEYESLVRDFLFYEFPQKYLDYKNIDGPAVLRDIISLKYQKLKPTDRIYSERFGFSNIMPIVKGLVDVKDRIFEDILNLLNDEKALGSKFGIKVIDGYETKMTNFISLECNWLILRGLKQFYWVHPIAQSTYNKMRDNLLGNLMYHYEKTGKFFEKYRADNGNPIGESSKMAPGLVLLIINEDLY